MPSAIIYRSEMDYISRCILDSPDIETGGQLFGLWTNAGVPVVLYAIGPGPDANHQPTWFQQDLRYLSGVGNFLRERYGLVHIGEWHSHHRLGLARPSGHDAANISGNVNRLGLDRFLLCIGNIEGNGSSLGAFSFKCGSDDYQQATWDIKEMQSPFRPLIDSIMAPVLCHPHTLSARYADSCEAPFVVDCRPAETTAPEPAPVIEYVPDERSKRKHSRKDRRRSKKRHRHNRHHR